MNRPMDMAELHHHLLFLLLTFEITVFKRPISMEINFLTLKSSSLSNTTIIRSLNMALEEVKRVLKFWSELPLNHLSVQSLFLDY